MNKVVALSLVSVFILSILVGYLPVLTTQAATGNPQGYLVLISPPYYVAYVVTNVNLGSPQLGSLIGYELNKTLTNTSVTISLINAQTGQVVSEFTGNVNTTYKYYGDYDAYYSPAANAVVILFALNQSSATTLPMSYVLYQIQRATGISLVNGTYPYLIDVAGNKVYTNGTAVMVTANAIVNRTGYSLTQWNNGQTPGNYYGIMTSTAQMQANGYELTMSVVSNVLTSTSPAPLASSAQTILFAPIEIVNIHNEMMNGQAVGWGRSLINITVYNPIEASTTLYLYQLNFTGPGTVTVYFYPAVQVYSVDQLFLQKPEVGLFSFTGQGTGLKAYNYTLLIVSSSPTITLKAYYNGGKLGKSPMTIVGTPVLIPVYFTFNGKTAFELALVFVYAITFSNTSSNSNTEIWQVSVNGYPSHIKFAGTSVPVYAVYVNSSAYALQISGAQWFYYTTYGNTPQKVTMNIPAFNLTLTNNLPLKPFPVSTQLETTSYEEFDASTAYYSLGGNDYGGPFFTTPPGNNTIIGVYTLTGNATIGKTYTTVYVTGFNTYVFKQLNSTAARISILGTLGTPAYPMINGTLMSGVNIMAETYNYTQAGSEYVYVNVTTANYSSSQVGSANNLTIVGKPFYFVPFYGMYVKYTSAPAVQIISPSTETFTLYVTPSYFYVTMVSLGLWSNMTYVYVKGWAKFNGQWYQMLGIKYFRALIIPPAVMMSNVTPRDFVCSNAVWVNFYSPDDVLVTGNFGGEYALNVTSKLAQLPPNMVVGGAAFNTTKVYGIHIYNVTTGYFLGASYIGVPVNQIDGSRNTYLVTNVPGVSNYTAQTNVVGGLVITGTIANGVPLNWTDYTPGLNAINVNGVTTYNVTVPDVLPVPVPSTFIPTPNFNISVYLRYQVDYAAPANIAGQLMPDIYYGPLNSIIVITPPNLTVGSRLTISFVSGDFAVHHYFQKNYWNKTVTIVVPNTTLTLKAPSVVPLYDLTAPLQVIEQYYAMPFPAQLAIGTNVVSMIANSYDFFGVYPKAYAVGVGKFVNITIRFANGTTERIYLTGNNVTTLFQGGVMDENGSCTGAYNATISIQGLMSILHLTSVKQLNGSCLTITYYDNITHATATAKICFGGVSVVSPVLIKPALIFYILTAKYVNATAGLPVTLAQSVAVQPYVSLNDTFLAKAMTGVVANLNVTNVTIIDHYGNKYVIYYNSTNGSTNVMINGKMMYAYKGYLLPTIPETAPNTGIFNGTPITFVVNMPGTIYKNGTVFNGTLAVKLGSNVATLGPATNFALPAYSFAGKLFGYNSTMYVTVEDTVSSSTLTLKTYIAAYNITPIRIAPVTLPVPMPANASTKIQYVYNQPITLTPTSQYIVIHVTSIVNYTYVFYIATLVQQGKNATTVPPILVNFQTVVPVPVIGPGIVAQVPVQFSQIGALGSGYYTITMFAVPFAGGPVISLYPAKLVFTNVYVNTTVV